MQNMVGNEYYNKIFIHATVHTKSNKEVRIALSYLPSILSMTTAMMPLMPKSTTSRNNKLLNECQFQTIRHLLELLGFIFS